MSLLKVIKNAKVVLEDRIIDDGVIVIEDGKIRSFGSVVETQIPEGAEIIDAEGLYAGPGFVDIHVHGGGGYSTAKQPHEAARFFLSHGATTILATPDYMMNFDEYMEAMSTINESLKTSKIIKGIYSEGPYINPKYGAYADKNPWRAPIDESQYKALVDEAGKNIRVWAIAPEREGLVPFLEYARSVQPDVIFALAHSEATPMQVRALGEYVPSIMTHTFNATGRLPVPLGTRGYGPDEYCLKEKDMYAELISDSCTIHVHSELQQLLLHCKGVDKVILITDSTVIDNESPAHLAHIKDLNFDDRGELAGSKMTMELACHNIMISTGCSIADTFKMASSNPARAVGLFDKVGSIDVGKNADIVIVDGEFNISKVIFEGEVCKF